MKTSLYAALIDAGQYLGTLAQQRRMQSMITDDKGDALVGVAVLASSLFAYEKSKEELALDALTSEESPTLK